MPKHSTTIRLRPVNHGTCAAERNRFCGPSALSAATGMQSGEAARLLRKVSGRSKITGCHTHHLRSAFALCNVEAVYVPNWRDGAKTLGQWLKASASWRRRKPYLVVAGNHFQLVQGRSYVCGITKDVVSQKHPKVRRKARIEEVYELRVKPGCHIVVPADARRPKPKVNESYRAFRAYCKERGLTYEIAYDDYIEFSDGIQFPFYGDWDEVLERHQDRFGEE